VSTQTRTYSDFGELTATTWAPQPPYTERRIENDYDAYGRITQTREKNDDVVDPATLVDYAYDESHATSLFTPTNLLGRLTYTHSAAGDSVFSYDALGNLANHSYFDEAQYEYGEGYEYHADGSLSSLTLQLPDNRYRAERVSYAYDSAGRTSSMWFDDGVDTRDLYSATSDVFGRIRDAKFGNGNTNVFHADYADTGRRLPKRISVTTPAGVRALDFDKFDALGREIERREEFGNYEDKQTSAFDQLGRLLRTDRYTNNSLTATSGFSYDALGNITRLTSAGWIARLAYDPVDRDRVCGIRYSVIGLPTCSSMQYDNLGGITSMPTTNGTRTLSYFNSGAVRSIARGGTTAKFQYDAQGAVAKLDITNGATLLRSDRNFGPYMTARTQSGPFGLSSFTSRSFPGPGVTISRRGVTGPWLYEFSEERGTRFTVDDDGKFKQDVSYTPFGIAVSTGVGAGDATFTAAQWNGGDALDGLGVVQLGARIYDPVIGRFLSRDPLMIPRGATTSNPYAFAWNDPMNGSDPTGLDTCWGICRLAIGGSTAGQQAPPSSASSPSSGLGIYGTVTLGIVYSLVKSIHDHATSDHGFSGPQASYSAPPPLMTAGRILASIASRAVGGSNRVTWGDVSQLWQTSISLGGEPIEAGLRGVRSSIREGRWLAAYWHLRGLSEDVGAIILLGGYRVPTGCLGACSKLFCFAKGTKIETPNGLVNIEDIKVGDKVMSFSLGAGKAIERTVTELIRSKTEHWYNVTIDGDTFKVTGAHPFWIAREKRWIHARELAPGMKLQQLNGTFSTVTAVKIEALGDPEATYNFEVEEDHNYYAGTSRHAVLVHNSDPFDILFSRDPAAIEASDRFLHGPWAGRTLGEAAEEARALNRLPAGLELNASWVNDEMVAANNRTLWVAQQAGLENVSVGGLESNGVAKVVQTHLRESGGPFCAP
jgi:RHS repeat-associated protein